ncbi:hypothetical protein Plhal304r1_c006g0023581 [Plasmopara halstedii]
MYDWDLLYRDRPGASLPSFFLSDEKRIEPPSAFQSQDGSAMFHVLGLYCRPRR